MSKRKTTHGGKRTGAGRKARFGAPMVQKTVRLPRQWIERLIAEFGSFQAGVESLVKHHLREE